ncbi:hypothetical protein V5T82_14135 [Magnetovibrio sp. PR-2]|uniref:hypothetical protein n=1 Tax=Magnetovibrio sp. PR-2 TaxID=3120356 RepID=UPI002FCDFC35
MKQLNDFLIMMRLKIGKNKWQWLYEQRWKKLLDEEIYEQYKVLSLYLHSYHLSNELQTTYYKYSKSLEKHTVNTYSDYVDYKRQLNQYKEAIKIDAYDIFDKHAGYMAINNFDNLRDVAVDERDGTNYVGYLPTIYGHEIATAKDKVPMFNFCIFKTDGMDKDIVYTKDGKHVKRVAANVKSITALVLDYDGEMSIEQAKLRFEDYDYWLYTSWGHKTESKGGKDAFRVVLPFWHAIPVDVFVDHKVEILEWLGSTYDPKTRKFTSHAVDQTTLNIARAFFTPSCAKENIGNAVSYYNETNVMLELDIWRDAHFERKQREEREDKMSELREMLIAKQHAGVVSKKYKNAKHESIYNSDIVKAEYLTDYYNNDDGSWHVGFYKVLCRIAGRAKGIGYALTATELAGIAREIDCADSGGPFYDNDKYNKEAVNALKYIGVTT